MEYTADDLTAAWTGMLVHMWKGRPDSITQSGATWYDVVLQVKSMHYNVNLATFGFDKQRFTKLVRQYIEPSLAFKFLDVAEDIALGRVKHDGVAGMTTKVSIERGSKHFFGNCILAFGYRGLRSKPVLTMHSRTSYLPTIGLIDLALAYVVADAIGQRIGVGAHKFRFIWYADSLQFPGPQSLKVIATIPDFKRDVENIAVEYPVVQMVRRHWRTAWRAIEEEKVPTYGPLRRAVASLKALEEVKPPLLPADLSLESLRRR